MKSLLLRETVNKHYVSKVVIERDCHSLKLLTLLLARFSWKVMCRGSLEASGTQVLVAVVVTVWLLGVICGRCCCGRRARVIRHDDGHPARLLARLELGLVPSKFDIKRLPSGESFSVPRTLGEQRPGRK